MSFEYSVIIIQIGDYQFAKLHIFVTTTKKKDEKQTATMFYYSLWAVSHQDFPFFFSFSYGNQIEKLLYGHLALNNVNNSLFTKV